MDCKVKGHNVAIGCVIQQTLGKIHLRVLFLGSETLQYNPCSIFVYFQVVWPT